MKVLENALTATDTVYCGNCGSKLEIKQYDLFETPVSLFSYSLAFICPVCKKTRSYKGILRNAFYCQRG